MADEQERLTPEQIARRRDDAIRRALNTPKPEKKPSKGTPKKARQSRGDKI
jgi:hypothetical protein